MNKTELIEAVAQKSGLTKADSDRAIAAVVETIGEVLKSGDKLQLVGFGTFETNIRPAAERRNPATGLTIQVAQKRVPKFKAGKGLKDLVAQ